MRPARLVSALGSIALVATVVAVPTPAYAAPGDLDTSYGVNGVRTLDYTYARANGLAPHGLAVDSQGRAIVLEMSADMDENDSPVYTRLTPTGAKDATFKNGSGTFTDQQGAAAGSSEYAPAVAVDHLDRPVFVSAYKHSAPAIPSGTYVSSTTQVQRLTTTGTNEKIGHYDDIDEPADLAISPGNDVYVAGATYNWGAADDLTVVKLRASDLEMDTSFAAAAPTPGHFTLDLPSFDAATSIAVAPDGDLLVGGYSQPAVGSPEYGVGTLLVLRLNPDGTPDAGFGTNGLVTITPPAGYGTLAELDVDASGRILVAGYQQPCQNSGTDPACAEAKRPILLRLTPGGALDTGFGVGGWATLPATLNTEPFYFRSVSVDPAGWILTGAQATGATPSASPAKIARFTPSGTPDPTFGAGGVVAGYGYSAEDVEPGPGGSILAAGWDASTTVAKLQGGGAPSSDAPSADAPSSGTPGGSTPQSDVPAGSSPPPATTPLTVTPTVAIKKPKGKVKAITGSAGPAGGIASVKIAVQKVDKRLLTKSKKCSYLATTKPMLKRYKAAKAGKKRVCKPAKWLKLTPGTAWKLKLKKKLPTGTYVATVVVTSTTGHTVTKKVTFKSK